MAIECSRCGGNHMRSECPTDGWKNMTVSICYSKLTEIAAPQGNPFHWRDGWMFCRGEAGAVHIYRSGEGFRDDIELKIPFSEWESILKHLNGNLP